MNKRLYGVAVACAFLGMGIAMPSCPGQEEMKQQIEALNTQNQANLKTIQNLNGQISTLNHDMGEVKTLLAQVSNTVLAQKASIEQLEAAAKVAAARPAAPARSATPSRRRR